MLLEIHHTDKQTWLVPFFHWAQGTSNTWKIFWNMLRCQVCSQKTISYATCVRENDLCLTIRPSVGMKCNYIRLQKKKQRINTYQKALAGIAQSILSSYFVCFLPPSFSIPSKLTLCYLFLLFLVPLHLFLLSLQVHKRLLLSSVFLFILISLLYFLILLLSLLFSFLLQFLLHPSFYISSFYTHTYNF
jgi:hypothetical protein